MTKYRILHIPTSSYLFNPVVNEYWIFGMFKVAHQLLEPNCPINLKFDCFTCIKEGNQQIDWNNFDLTEFEVVEFDI